MFCFPFKIYAPEQPAPCFACYFSFLPQTKPLQIRSLYQDFYKYNRIWYYSLQYHQKEISASFFVFLHSVPLALHLSCHIHDQAIIHCYKHNQTKTFAPTIPKKTFHWLNITLNGSPSYVFWTLHVDFQTLQRSIPRMRTSKKDIKKMMVVKVEEKRRCLV